MTVPDLMGFLLYSITVSLSHVLSPSPRQGLAMLPSRPLTPRLKLSSCLWFPISWHYKCTLVESYLGEMTVLVFFFFFELANLLWVPTVCQVLVNIWIYGSFFFFSTQEAREIGTIFNPVYRQGNGKSKARVPVSGGLGMRQCGQSWTWPLYSL